MEDENIIELEVKILCLCIRELTCGLLVHFLIQSTKYLLRSLAVFFRVLKSCLIIGVMIEHW